MSEELNNQTPTPTPTPTEGTIDGVGSGPEQPEQNEAGAFDPTPNSTPQILRYLGGGALVGIPARDIPLSEARELGLDLDNIFASGHYRLENITVAG